MSPELRITTFLPHHFLRGNEMKMFFIITILVALTGCKNWNASLPVAGEEKGKVDWCWTFDAMGIPVINTCFKGITSKNLPAEEE